MNLNKAFILGNVTQDPQVRAMPNGQQVVSFSIATNRFYTDAQGQKKQDAEFHNIVAFGKLADISARYITKGSLVMIEGRIKTRNWVNTAGAKQYKTEIIADSLQLGPRPQGGSNNQAPYQKSQPQSSQPQSQEIPIIEENSLPAGASNPPPVNNNEPLPESFDMDQDKNSDEIDVKDIPF